ncbi:MAG: GGDEF domain-containing protein [Pseudolabrys sp.]
MPFIAGIAALLIGFAGFSFWQLRRAQRDLTASQELAARAADKDKVTGLPNYAKTLELLDLTLSERTADEVTTFALIELDGMADVNADLGVLGGDELMVAVAQRLREALPADAVCGRIGSDEFAVTLHGGPDLDAEAVIRAALESIARPHWIDTVCGVSAHAGFAQTPRHANTRG